MSLCHGVASVVRFRPSTVYKMQFFFVISRPILIVIALFGRAELRTLNFYTAFWKFAPLINYGNLCKFMGKNITKIASSGPIFILFVLSDRASYDSKPVHKISKFIALWLNLCKFIQNPNKITKNAFSPIIFSKFWFSLTLSGRSSLVHFYTEFLTCCSMHQLW